MRAPVPARSAAWRRATVVLLGLLALSACATTRVPRTVLAPELQAELLRALPGFRLEGRIGGRAGEEAIRPASLDWRQQGEQGALRLAGPFGAGSLRLEWRPGHLRITSGRGDVLENADAEALLVREVGFVPPLEALRFWVLGLRAPGDGVAGNASAESGRLEAFTQHDWHVRYDRWMKVAAGGGGVELPQRVTLTRGELTLRVFVERWKL